MISLGPFNILPRFPQLRAAIWNVFTVLAGPKGFARLRTGGSDTVYGCRLLHYSYMYEL